MIEDLKSKEDITVGSYVSSKEESKHFMVKSLSLYYDKDTLLPFLSPVLISMRADNTLGRVNGSYNFTSNYARHDYFIENEK